MNKPNKLSVLKVCSFCITFSLLGCGGGSDSSSPTDNTPGKDNPPAGDNSFPIIPFDENAALTDFHQKVSGLNLELNILNFADFFDTQFISQEGDYCFEHDAPLTGTYEYVGNEVRIDLKNDDVTPAETFKATIRIDESICENDTFPYLSCKAQYVHLEANLINQKSFDKQYVDISLGNEKMFAQLNAVIPYDDGRSLELVDTGWSVNNYDHTKDIFTDDTQPVYMDIKHGITGETLCSHYATFEIRGRN